MHNQVRRYGHCWRRHVPPSEWGTRRRVGVASCRQAAEEGKRAAGHPGTLVSCFWHAGVLIGRGQRTLPADANLSLGRLPFRSGSGRGGDKAPTSEDILIHTPLDAICRAARLKSLSCTAALFDSVVFLKPAVAGSLTREDFLGDQMRRRSLGFFFFLFPFYFFSAAFSVFLFELPQLASATNTSQTHLPALSFSSKSLLHPFMTNYSLLIGHANTGLPPASD